MSIRKRTLIITIVAPLILMSLACMTSSPAGERDGTWVGVTTQEERIELVVKRNTVTLTKFGAVVAGDGWEVPTEQSLSVKAPIKDDGSFHILSESDDWLVEVEGTFQESRVEGVVVVTYLPAEKWEMLTFVASQEV